MVNLDDMMLFTDNLRNPRQLQSRINSVLENTELKINDKKKRDQERTELGVLRPKKTIQSPHGLK